MKKSISSCTLKSYLTPSGLAQDGRKTTRTGFTIVELLIVIVVIAILAAISVVAYTGIQNRAAQTAIVSEANQWRKLFEAYKAVNGNYPSPVASGDPLTSGGPGSNTLNNYCLGTGFPQSGGDTYCHVASSGSSYRVVESTGAHLLSLLSDVGVPPANTKKYLYGGVTGPLLRYYAANNLQIYTTFPSGTSCTSLGMQTGFGDASRQDCYYTLN